MPHDSRARPKKRGAVVDAFLKARLAQGRESAVFELLPFATEGFVSSVMADFAQGGGNEAWSRLCARHPRFAAKWFLDDLKRGESVDPRQRYRLYGELAGLAQGAPDETLKLVLALFERGEQLRDHSDPRLRRIALAALIQSASPSNGWSKERRARLERYQADPSPNVAGPAQFVFPP